MSLWFCICRMCWLGLVCGVKGVGWVGVSLDPTDLVLFALIALFVAHGLGANLFVVLLKGGEILTSLRELSLFHTLTDVPVDEGALGIHHVELMVDAREHLSDGGGVGDHADGALDLGKVAAGNNGGGLVVDADLESGGAPVDELDRALRLDRGDGRVNILGDHVSAVHKAAGHVLAMSRVALRHHRRGLECGGGDLTHRQLLVVRLLGRDDGGVGRKHEVDTRVRDQVGLELRHVDVQGAVEAEGGGEGGDDLSDQAVEVGVGGALDVQGATADVVDGLVVKHDGNIRVLKQRVGGEDGVVWLHDSGGHLRGGVDGESKLRLLAVVDGQPLEEERAESGAGAATDGVEEEEALETSAVVGKLADAVKAEIDDLFAYRVVTTGVVVGGVLLSRDELLGVEKLPVRSCADFVDDGGLEIEEDAAGDVLAGASFGEKGVERVVASSNGGVGWHLAVRLDSVLEAVKLPAGISDLDTGLSDVDRDDFA